MTNRLVKSEAYRWLMLGLLGALVIVTTAMANRNVYSKDVVNDKVAVVRELHINDKANTDDQLDRIEVQVDRLVDKLIEEQ